MCLCVYVRRFVNSYRVYTVSNCLCVCNPFHPLCARSLIVCVFIRLSFRLSVRGNDKKCGEYGMRNEEEREKDGGKWGDYSRRGEDGEVKEEEEEGGEHEKDDYETEER